MNFPSLKRIPKWWQQLYWDEYNEAILLTPKELRKVDLKFALYCYYLLAVEVFNTLEIILNDYTKGELVFVPAEDRLEQLYHQLHLVACSLGSRPDFIQYEVPLLRLFPRLNGDFKTCIKEWQKHKIRTKREIELLGQTYPQPYPRPNDFQVLVAEMKVLLANHLKKKVKVLQQSHDILLTSKYLTLNQSTATLTYKKKSVSIQLERKEVKLLIELMKHQGKIVSYQELAHKLDVATDTPDADLGAIKESLKYIKRDLGKYLVEVGLHAKSVSAIMDAIHAIKNQGYQLKT